MKGYWGQNSEFCASNPDFRLQPREGRGSINSRGETSWKRLKFVRLTSLIYMVYMAE